MKIKLNLDSIALLLLCSDLIITDLNPLNSKQWYFIEKKLRMAGRRPSRLLGLNETNLFNLINDHELVEMILNRFNLYGDLLYALYNLESLDINITTIYEESYPTLLKSSLKKNNPLYLYYSGDIKLMNNMASIIGLHKNDRSLMITTRNIIKKLIEDEKTLISTDNEGIENYSLRTYLSLKGKAVCFVSDHMIDKLDLYKKYIRNNNLLLVSAIDPYAFFNVTNAIDRNMYISALSDYQILIASLYNSGETWLSATLNLSSNLSPLLVYENINYDGNMKLLTMGALPLSKKEIKSKDSIETIIENKYKNEIIEEDDLYQMSIYDFIEE